MFKRITIVVALAWCCAPASAQPSCLETVWRIDADGGGSMFDITPRRDLQLTRWHLNVTSIEMVTVEVYWREGTYVGHESDPSAWTFLGSATTQAQGMNYPTIVNVGALPVHEGATYGIYVHLASFENGASEMLWGIGNGRVFENDDLRITTGPGMGFPAFTGADARWMWSGAVCYENARPYIALEGRCPGRLLFRWQDAPPNQWAGICYSDVAGRFTLPAGPCGGTVLGLGGRNLRLVHSFNTGADGQGSLSALASAPFCIGYVQIIVMDGPCQTSNVIRVPD